jgi:endoglucanase
MTRTTLMASTVFMTIASANAVTMQSGSVDGFEYKYLISPGGCSTAKPCRIIEYLSDLGGGNQVPTDINRRFNMPQFRTADPSTIVVAPQVSGSSDSNYWGGVQSGASSNGQAAGDAAKRIEAQYAKYATNPNGVVMTGGSIGGIDTRGLLRRFGPKGSTGEHVYVAGAAYDGADYARNPASAKAALCGVRIVQNGSFDTTVNPRPDRAPAQMLAGCPGFIYTALAGARFSSATQLSITMAAAPGGLPAKTAGSGAQAGAALTAAANTAIDSTIAAATTGCTSTNGNNVLPEGYFSTKGSQIVAADDNPVRIASVGWNQVSGDIPAQVAAIRAYGFNAIRLSWVNATMDSDLTKIDQVVAAAKANGLKVILDNHTNEPGHGDRDNWGAQQKNGLWYDQGGASDNTDGGGNAGTVPQAKFQQDWVTVAQHFAANDTVIGFDIRNEPLAVPRGSTWGDDNPSTDIRMMYQAVGGAIQAVNPGVLIIAEGPQHYPDMPWGDLSRAASMPVRLSVANKVVYSIHDYPKYVSNAVVNSGPAKVAAMNVAWGYLVTQGIAPVWIGEMGANFDGSYGGESIADSQAWFQTLLDYISGKDAARGGPTFSEGQAGVSWDWWAWGKLPGEQLNGTMTDNGPNAVQKAAVDQLITATCITPVAASSVR